MFKASLLAAVVMCFGGICIVDAAAASGGHVLGGVTPQGWPVVIQLTGKKPLIKRATIGLDLKCTSGSGFSDTDYYGRLRFKRSGSFSSSFSGLIEDIGNGQTVVESGHISGKANKTRTRISGRWQLHETFRDNTAHPVDECHSGTVAFTVSD